jgi:uncharacterized glyoxalase superfamily protein PhnB
MTKNPPDGFPRITPYLLYEDAAAALEWLTRAFGLRERSRMAGADGTVRHAEMTFADGVVMLGHPGPDFESPRTHGKNPQFLYVYVDDVDQHFERARGAGAKILATPEEAEYGDRRYAAADLEGHHWWFAQRIRDP